MGDSNSWKFHSEWWFPDICNLASDFLSYFTKKHNAHFLQLDMKKLNMVPPYYYDIMLDFKTQTYGDDAENHNIDHHKILALYIKSILRNQPFIVPKSLSKEVLRSELLANEYFCFVLMDMVFKAWNGDAVDKKIRMPQDEKKSFIKTLYDLKNNLGTFNTVLMSLTIYKIEKSYFK